MAGVKEGVIKYKYNQTSGKALDAACIADLNRWRSRLYQLELIGVNNDGIGYGNISARYREDTFIITGSATGNLATLAAAHYALVTGFNLEENTLTMEGPARASSESLTHAVIYQHEKGVHAVIHVHHAGLWNKLLRTLPATGSHVAYGTPAMAAEVARLFRQTNLSTLKIFAMAGHEDGIVSFGKDLDEAGQILLDQLMEVH